MADEIQPCIDIGINLTHKSFRQDLTDVIYRARDAGVVAMIVTGTSVRSSQDAADLSENFPGTLYGTAGVHPHHADQFDHNTIPALKPLIRQSHVVAVGECGLDYYRDFSPRPVQRDCFEAQLNLAAAARLPVFLHERGAFAEFVPILRAVRDRLPAAVVHCFTGSREQLYAYLDLDLHVGVTGWICDPRRGDTLREVVRDIPANRLMIETDAPFLPPRDLDVKVKRNEPQYLPHILRVVGDCRGESVASLSWQIFETTCAFFNLPRSVSP